MSHYHTQLNRRRWAWVRRQALNRAGWRSELSGRSGRLEVHHIRPLHQGGDPYALANLLVLTRAEHIGVTRQENRRILTPAEEKWRKLVETAL